MFRKSTIQGSNNYNPEFGSEFAAKTNTAEVKKYHDIREPRQPYLIQH